MKNNYGLIAVIFLSTIPILLWFPSIISEFSLRNLSQLLALVGTVVLSINFILSARFKTLENFFGGLGKMYTIHRLLGQYALIFLVLHPVFLGLYYLRISFEAASNILFPSISEFATWLGLGALDIMIILLLLTLYIHLPYNIWRQTHKYFGISLLLASLHIFFINSTVTTNIPLRIYMLSICIIGIASYIYRVLLGKFLVKRYKYLVSKIQVTGAVTDIELTPTDNYIKTFLPGQFIFTSFESTGITSEVHPFSLTNSPGEKSLSISIKSLGDYTETLKHLKGGSEAMVEGPFGRFSYLESRRTKQVWIAGGIGITPFVSMTKNLIKTPGYDIYLYYVVKTPNEAIFLSLLKNISGKNSHFKIFPFFSNKNGHISKDVILEDVPDLKERDIFICGPYRMMKDLRNQFNEFGITNSHIFSEDFYID